MKLSLRLILAWGTRLAVACLSLLLLAFKVPPTTPPTLYGTTSGFGASLGVISPRNICAADNLYSYFSNGSNKRKNDKVYGIATTSANSTFSQSSAWPAAGAYPVRGDLATPTAKSATKVGNMTVALDSDGDGVDDSVDLDDDNDGILDSVEESCGFVSGLTVLGNQVTGSLGTINFTFTKTGTSNIPLTVGTGVAFNSPTFNPSGSPSYIVLGGANGGTITFSSPVTGLRLGIRQLANNTWTFNKSFSLISSDGDFTISGNSITGVSSNGGATNPLNDANGTIEFSGSVSSVSWTNNGNDINDGIWLYLYTCSPLDTDGDGIANSLDLDSDGDGCSDAIEGGSSFTTANLVTSTMAGGNSGTGYTGTSTSPVTQNLGNIVGNTTTTMGVPTIAGAGQTVGTSQDKATQDANCTVTGTVSVVQATCGTAGGANADAKLILTSYTGGATKVGYSTGSSYVGPAFATATALTAAPMNVVTNLANPVSDQPYTIRLFRDAAVYQDYVVLLKPQVCLTADLSLAVTPPTKSANKGEQVTYTFTLTNAGPDAAPGVTACIAIPANTTFLSATTSQGTYNSGTTIWDLGTVPVGSQTITMTLQIK